MRFAILSIGFELLIGRVVNTNSAFLCSELAKRGHEVGREITVGDELTAISGELKHLIQEGFQNIITTGGLGPTFDDMTAEGVAMAFGLQVEENSLALQWITDKYDAMKLPLTAERRKMCRLPVGAQPIYNSLGTAPGFLFADGRLKVLALPGVPAEMIAIFQENLEQIFPSAGRMHEREIRITGLPESTLATYTIKLMRKYSSIYIKTHPRSSEGKSEVLVHAYAMSGSDDVESQLDSLITALRSSVEKLGGRVEE
jgi:molybdenum cofactor synthesis domain-containing protein